MIGYPIFIFITLQERPAYGCPIGRETCRSLDPVQNYMDYSEDWCTEHFTLNQAERMLAQWCEYRTDSPPSPPCTLTPTPEPCKPRGYDLGSCPSGLDSICCSGKCFLNTGKCKPWTIDSWGMFKAFITEPSVACTAWVFNMWENKSKFRDF